VRLPYDEYEEWEPASWSAHMMLYESFTSDVEDSPVDDLGWLDRMAEVCAAAAPPADDEVRACLATLLYEYELPHAVARRVRTLTAGVSGDAEPLAAVGGDEEARCAAVVAVLRAIGHHGELVAAAEG
jgi:hypothetical protein